MHPSTRVSQPSGGRQSFNLFSSEPAAAPAPTRSSTRVHNKPASFNPMNPDGAREQQPRRSRVVRQNSATFTSDANSPFSKAPRPQAPPREHRANVPSAGNPFGSDDGAPAPAPTHQRRPSMANKPSDGNPFVAGGVPPPQPAQREYRANVPSQASPFSNAPAPPQPQQQRPVPRANAPSHDLPFSAPASAQAQYQQVAPPQPAQPKVRSSVRLHQPAGGRTSIDLFGRKPEEARPVRNNPTYQSDVDLAFDPTPKPEMHTPTRRPSRANVPAQNSPFNPAAAEQPPAEPRRGPEPRANKPARDSPFNPAPDAPRPANRNRANRPSMQGGPFGGPVEQAPQRSSVRMHHRPGGKQNINLFGGHNYPS